LAGEPGFEIGLRLNGVEAAHAVMAMPPGAFSSPSHCPTIGTWRG